MMESGTLVSVIIPSYGRADFLAQSIDSIVKQDHRPLELIIVDDNGAGTADQQATEHTVTSIQADFPIIYIKHEKNRGGAAARNTGVDAAQGQFIALLDNDDLSLPNRISKQLALLQDKHRADPCIQACLCLPIRMKYGKEIDREVPKDKTNYLFELLAVRLTLHIGSSILLFKSAYQQLNGFDEQFRRNQDIEFMIRFYEKYHAVILNEHLIVINIDDRSNIPNYRKIVETKQLLLNKYKTLIEQFTPPQQKEIYKSHHLEIAKVALWNKNIGGFIQGLRSAKLSFPEIVSFFVDVVKKAIMHLK